MDVALRSGLVEVPCALPAFASQGVERRAADIAGIAASAFDYLAGLLDVRPEAQVLVLSEADWAVRSEVALFGLPNAGEGTLTVAGVDAEWWSSLTELAGDDGQRAIDAIYAGPDGRIELGPFFDLVAVHEVAHLFAEDRVGFPRKWLGELFANLCLHAWVDRRAPESLPTLVTLPRLGARAPADQFEFRSREQFEESYGDIPGPNYVWYQFRLQVAAEALYEAIGEIAVRRLFDAFPIGSELAADSTVVDDRTLADRLGAAVDPALGAFSLAF